MNRIETKVLTSVIGLLGTVSIWFMKDISSNMKQLNVNVATVIERNNSLEKRVDKIENYILKDFIK
jgi:hypothetical protein